MTTIILFGIASLALWIAMAWCFYKAFSYMILGTKEPQIQGYKRRADRLIVLTAILWLLNIYLAVNTF